jgi:hypothetical protein
MHVAEYYIKIMSNKNPAFVPREADLLRYFTQIHDYRRTAAWYTAVYSRVDTTRLA